MKYRSKLLKAGICICLSALMSGTAMLSAFATAGEDPGTVDDNDKTFPDPSSFSYDDVEVNFAKGLQYTLHFYDANKCGKRTGRLEWRADCHMEDQHIPLKQYGEDFKGINLPNSWIEEHKAELDPDGDGCLDLEGGMHDAGDHVKFGLPGSYAASTLGWGYYEFRDAYEKTGNAEHMEEILHAFCDFYLKALFYDKDGNLLAYCYQVGEGNIDHNYWLCPDLQGEHLLDFARPAYLCTQENVFKGGDSVGAAESKLENSETNAAKAKAKQTDSRASDMCGGAAAALAISYLNFKDTDPDYAKKCLKGAKDLYEMAVNSHEEDDSMKVLTRGYDGGFYESSYDYDEISWAAVWLYYCACDGDISVRNEEAYEKYITPIISIDMDTTFDNGGHPYTGWFRRIMKDTNNCWNNIWVHCWDTVWGGVFAKLAPVTNIQRDWYIFRWNCEFWSGVTHLDPGLVDTIYDQPFEWDKDPAKPEWTDFLSCSPAGFAVLNEYGSARYNTAGQLCCLVYAKEALNHEKAQDPLRFAKWAEGQMEYIMGKNPMNRPYIVGWSPTAASHPHHRAAHGSKDLNMDHPATQVHVLWGALVGGPDSKDWHRDITKDYVYNEVAVDYNAAVVGACAGLYHFFGTEDMKNQENFPPPEASYKSPEELREFVLKAAVGQDNNRSTQVLIAFTNETLLPPRYLKEAKARYYFNISELIAEGQTVDDINVEMQYDKMAANSQNEYQVKTEIVQYNDKGDCYVEMTWGDFKYYGEMDYQFAIVAPKLKVVPADEENPNERHVAIWDSTNDYSRQDLASEEALGKSLNECPEEYDRITLYVDGKHVWGVSPADAPALFDEVPGKAPNPIEAVGPAVTTAPVSTGTGKQAAKYGDVNCDNKVDVSDVVLLSRILVEDREATVTEQGLLNADVKKDGKRDPDDCTKILRYIAKIIKAEDLGTAD
ncbi:MAG: glycoside hydrolase family 9 protein [Oscillospiraceae bacterium]|nr:glycoside hydrolase family 9 protein [Oscillospiraceae bacterium]